ncbi:unnamed protein product [Enterobius vermicularis]|uniref:C6 domain-containing protein n=1 Tax=Enterobius vermicularis TaxID=51028 RepID=A0A0N4UVP8_ENTVE|nr:unnamed protein product [Enterobius vermicularis]
MISIVLLVLSVTAVSEVLGCAATRTPECVCQLPTLFNLTDAFTMGSGRITQIGDLLGCPSYAYTCSCAQTAINCRTVTVAAISETGELTVYPLTSTTPAEVAIQLTCESGSTWTVVCETGVVWPNPSTELVCYRSWVN